MAIYCQNDKMVKEYIIDFGQYNGDSVEQVALKDYLYLDWMLKGIKDGSFQKRLSRDFVGRIEEIVEKLNNFESPLACANGCGDNVSTISVALQVLGRDAHNRDTYGMSAGTGFAYCDKERCQRSTNYDKTTIHPVKFDTIKDFPRFPKWIRRDIQDLLVKCTGLKGRKTKGNVREAIDNLTLKGGPAEQLYLF